MEFDFDAFDRVEKDFDVLFYVLADTQKKIQKKLEKHSDGKVLKGNELVGWLGEIYTKILVNGNLVDDSHEHDVEASGNVRISVKTRKGTNSGWARTSAIPKLEGPDCPTHLMFVHLNDDYTVSSMWLYPWQDLLDSGRFKEHVVRGNFRSYYMAVNPGYDKKYRIYGGISASVAKEELQQRVEQMRKSDAIAYVNNQYGLNLNNQNTHYSKENAAKPVWWYEIPLSKIENEDVQDLYLIAERAGDLKVLKVPVSFFRDNRAGFKERTEKGVICLELDVDTYQNIVGSGKNDFSKFLL